ncbi:MAG: hypothetical protein WCP21_02165 [Armatimonadota bacterium]
MCVTFVMMCVHRCDWETAKGKADDWLTFPPGTSRAKRAMYVGGLILLVVVIVVVATFAVISAAALLLCWLYSPTVSATGHAVFGAPRSP